MHFTQAQTTIEYTGFIEALHLKTSICTRIPIPKDRLAAFTNYPSVSKDQAPYVVHGCFQLGVRIQLPVMMPSKANSQK